MIISLFITSSPFSHKRLMQHNAQTAAGVDANTQELMLYHGTDSEQVVRGIAVNGFDFRVSGKNATCFGQGAYFAKHASYSHRYTGCNKTRFMYRARVLVGQYTVGHSGLKRPPHRRGHLLYDSCVDSVSNPSIFVIFHQDQAYPEYLIQYEDKEVAKVIMPGPTLVRPRPFRVPPTTPVPSMPVTGPTTTPISVPIVTPSPPATKTPAQPANQDSKCSIM